MDIINAILLPITGGLLTMLTILIGWIGNRIHNRLEEINGTLTGIERDLRGDLTNLDRRITATETKLEYHLNQDRHWKNNG